MEETQYERALKLMRDTSSNIADLNALLKSPAKAKLSAQEQMQLQLEFLKLIAVVKEFGK